MKKKLANNIWNIIPEETNPVASNHLRLDQGEVLAKENWSIFCSHMAILTLCFTVHTVGIASDVPYRLQGHGLILTRQAGLCRFKEIHKQQIRTQ